MTEIKYKPLGKRIIIKNDPPKNEIRGILLSDDAIQKPLSGTIVACGPDCVVKVGNHVYYAKHVGGEVEIEGEKYFVINEGDIWLYNEETN